MFESKLAVPILLVSVKAVKNSKNNKRSSSELLGCPFMVIEERHSQRGERKPDPRSQEPLTKGDQVSQIWVDIYINPSIYLDPFTNLILGLPRRVAGKRSGLMHWGHILHPLVSVVFKVDNMIISLILGTIPTVGLISPILSNLNLALGTLFNRASFIGMPLLHLIVKYLANLN